MSRTMPKQKPGKSEQIVCTPPVFLEAVARFLEIDDFDIDLAANRDTRIVKRYLGPGSAIAEDALSVDWTDRTVMKHFDWAWLNPPYSKIKPWVKAAAIFRDSEPHGGIALLIPASVGSDWWADYVHGYAEVWFLNGRLTFVGHKQGYPKDLTLLLYHPQRQPGYDILDWRNV